MSQNDIARPKVILDGKQAEEELEKLTQKANKYREAMLAAAAAGDSKAEKLQVANFKAATKEISNFKREALDVDRVLKNINGASFNEISQASRKAMNDLKRMKQSDPGYADQQRNVSLLKNKLAELSSQSGVNVSVWEKLKNTASGLLPAFGFAAIAAGAKIAFDKVVGSTDFLSTKWEIFMGGMKAGTDEFFRTIATGDWSHFLLNMSEAVRVGREYADAMDRIEEKTRALRITEADSRAKELELEERLKNKGLSKEDRLKAGQERIKLEEDLSQKRVKVAQDAFNAELNVTMQQTRLSKERLMEVVSDMDSETKTKAQAYNDQLEIYQSAVKKNEQAKAGLSRAGISDNPFAKEMENSKDVLDSYPDSVKVYAEALRGVGNTTDEQLNKMVSAYEGLLTAQNSAAENTKRVRTQVNSLLAGKEEDGQKIEDLAAKRKKEAADKVMDILDQAQAKRNAAIVDQYEREAQSSEWFQEQQLAAEMAYLVQKKAILEAFGQSTVDIDNQIINKRIEAQNKLSEAQAEAYKIIADEAEKLSENSDKADADFITEQIDKTNKAIEDSKRIQEDQQKAEQQILEQRQETYLNFATMVGQSFGDLMADSEATFGDYLNQVLLMSLEALHQFLIVERAKALIKGAGTGFIGLAKAAAQIVLMEAAYQAVKGLLTPKKHAAGGYTEGEATYIAGEAGKEWIAPNWMVENPKTAPVIYNLEKMRETGKAVDITSLSRQNGSTPTVNMDSINKAINSFTFGLPPRGYVSSTGQTPLSNQGIQIQQVADPELKSLLLENSNMLRHLSEMEFNFNFTEFEKIQKRRAIREKQSKL